MLNQDYYNEKICCSILFTSNLVYVWLMEKNKPEWQKGSLNGLGGKIEEGETIIEAGIRELKEEGGIDLKEEDLKIVGRMENINNDENDFICHILTGITDKKLETMESEEVKQLPVDAIVNFQHIQNIPLLLEACKYCLNSSHFKEMVLKY